MTEELDLAVYGKTQTAGSSNVFVWTIFRVRFGRKDESLIVAAGSRPINNAAIDNTAPWFGATGLERRQPRRALYPFAVDPFGSRVIQQRGLMPILELRTTGFTTLTLEVKNGGTTS